MKLSDLPPEYQRQVQAQINENNKANDRRLGASVKEWQQTVVRSNAAEARVLGIPDARPRVRITMYRCGKPLDRDNKWIAPKNLCDGLIKAFELPGDSESEIDYHVEQIRVKTRKEIRTEIEIESE